MKSEAKFRPRKKYCQNCKHSVLYYGAKIRFVFKYKQAIMKQISATRNFSEKGEKNARKM